MRIYISGKMTGCHNLNRPAFDAAEARLLNQGHFVVNPADLSAMFGTVEEIERSFYALYNFPRKDGALQMPYMKHESILAQSIMDADLAAVRSCDAIYLLRGWESSLGAKKELAEALAHGLQVMQEGGEE